MTPTPVQFSLCWDAHKKNICSGLSSLQQNGEFVDMTLAADGHLVKVHQIIIALSSPYLKELIATAQCPHPIVFLNKISFATLSAVLEYVYTGEVLVSVENLTELIEAGRELHIRGLEDMGNYQSLSMPKESTEESQTKLKEEAMEDEVCYFEISDMDKSVITTSEHHQCMGDITQTETIENTLEETTFEEETLHSQENDNVSEESFQVRIDEYDKPAYDKPAELSVVTKPRSTVECPTNSVMQYTVSNQGNLQIILNRFMYYLKHTNRDGTRQWRCVDYLNASRCPALVITKDDVVLQRLSAHTHHFHDKKILKKLHANAIFTAVTEAERDCAFKKIKASEVAE